jgi:hypothetical protein
MLRIYMTQKKDIHEGQFEYLGRWVDKEHFCAFIYSGRNQRLVQNYEDFVKYIESGIWFASKQEALDHQFADERKNFEDALSESEIPKKKLTPKQKKENIKSQLRMANMNVFRG